MKKNSSRSFRELFLNHIGLLPVPVITATAIKTAAATVVAAAIAPFCFRTGNIYGDRLAFEIRIIECVDGLLPLRIVRHFDKPESARAAGFTVGNDVCGRYFPVLCE